MGKRAFLVLLALLGACSYTVTEDKRVDELVAAQAAERARLDALEGRVNAQGEELLRLRRGLVLGK